MSIISRFTPKIRHRVGDLSKHCTHVKADKVSAQVRTLIGEDDLELIRNAMIDRYAQVVVAEKDLVGTETSALYRSNSRLKVDWAAKEAILAGQQEIVRFYLYNSIIRQRATLFSEPTQRWEYEGDGTEEIIGDVRKEGGAQMASQRWDAFADGIGSCALYISDAGGTLQYSEIPPSKIWYAFSDTIMDGDRERPANHLALDEASVVAIEIAPMEDKRRFAAWFGPCDAWTDGRHVIYCAENWYDIPEPGTDGANDYSASAGGFVRSATDVANPLTLIARSQGADGSAPVYPIVFLYGDPLQGGLMPTTSSLYDTCAEIDLMGSMVIGAAGRGARGAKALKRGNDTAIPDQVDEGLVLLGREQELLNVGWPASHSLDAMKVLNEFSRHVAESYQVPGWLVVADQAGEVPSGVALEIMTLPLTRCRNARIELNRQSVARRFDIERLIVNGAVGTTAIPYDEVETWNAGERQWPKDPNLNLQQWQTRISMKEADLADVVQDLRSIKSREEALNWIEERTKERAENEALSPPKPEPVVVQGKPSLAERLGKKNAPVQAVEKDEEAERGVRSVR